MNIVKEITTLQNRVNSLKINSPKIGFVPTMGALHDGHISLIKEAKNISNIVVCSIFVNPTQFNNPIDLEKYPKTLEADIDKLEAAGCDILFLPTVAEMYPTDDIKKQYALGYLETILEGKYRPGHFQGVCIIVDKLLHAVQPTVMLLGRKDYQQCMVIKKMMELENHTAQLLICDTIRESDGLAMSSRNMRLNIEERKTAVCIIEALYIIKTNIAKGNLEPLIQKATNFLSSNGYKVDYIAIADTYTLELVNDWDGSKKLVVLAAAYLNEVRLIDNIVL